MAREFWRNRQNANGLLPAGDSSAIVTKNASDDVLNALPAGAGGIGALFQIPGVPAAGLALDFNADGIAGADGSTVSTWVDGSGFNVVATAIGTPVLKTGANGINGRNVVRFNGGVPLGTAETCCFTLPLDPSTWTGMSVYYVIRAGSGDSHNRYGGVFGWPQVTGSWFSAAYGNASDNAGIGWGGATGNALFGDAATFVSGAVVYQSYRYDKAQWTLDGARTTTVADTAWPSAALTALIGSNSFPFSQSDNDVARIIVFNRKLTDLEDAQVKAYLQYTYGQASPPGRELSIGYPETLTNYYARRFAHPAGNDANDGKTWQTAKATWLAAWDSAAAELDQSGLGTSGVIELELHDGVYVGGEVASQGFWLYGGGDSNPGAGWRAYRPHRIRGRGGRPAGRGFTPSHARIYYGKPGDSQAFDTTKPLIWITGGQTESTIDYIQPALYGFARLGVKAGPGNTTTTRDGNLSNLWWTGVYMISPPDTSAAYGPAYDCGWLNVCWFRYCQAFGSATMRPITLAAGDGASGTTITLTNGNFTSPNDDNGYLTITGGPNNGQWFIDHVISATQVTVHGPHALVTETFSTETIEKAPGPYVLDDDNHAGWLFRPTDAVAGDPGSMGEVYLEDCSYQQCGVKYYLGHEGEIGLFVRGFVSEGGPMPHPIQVSLMPGATVPDLHSSNTQIEVSRRMLVADGTAVDNYYVWIDPALHTPMGVGTCKVSDMQGGAVYGPCIWSGNDATEQSLTTTPTAQRQYGWFRNGKLTGTHDAAARLGLPGTALPSSTGSVGNHVTNLLSHDPSTWTGPALHYTAGVADVFGLTNAGKMDALSSGSLTIPQSSVAPASTTVATGDFIVAGVWVRASDGPNVALASIGCTSVGGSTPATLPNLPLQPTWQGNAQWEFFRAYGVVTAGGTGAFSMTIDATSASALVVAYPVLRILRLADGYTKEEAAAAADTLHAWNPLLAQGSAGTLRGQPFVASGSVGVDSSVLVTPSGAATPTKNLPIYGADGRTVIAWVPLLPSNSGMAFEPTVPWPASGEVMYSTGSGPTGTAGFTFAAGNMAVPGAVKLSGVTAGALLATDTGNFTAPVTVDAPVTYNGTTQHLSVSDFVGSGASHARGTVPDPGSTAGTLRFLREDGTWSTATPRRLELTFLLWNITLNASTLGGWLQENDRSGVYASPPMEYAIPFKAKYVTVCANLIANSIPVGPSLVAVATRNGSNIVGASAPVSSTDPTGSQSSGQVATGSASASDTYGLSISWGGSAGSGTVTISYTVYLEEG